MKCDSRAARIFISIVSFCVLITTIPANLPALAPVSQISSPGDSKKKLTESVVWRRVPDFLSVAFRCFPSKIQETLLDMGLPPNHLKLLLEELDSLMLNDILPLDQIKNLTGEPLRRAMAALIALAWNAQYSNPWNIKVKGRLPTDWNSVSWNNKPLCTMGPPDAETSRLLASSFKITNFSQENFFKHTSNK